MVTRPTIEARAHRHMSEALAFGWVAQSHIEDYAIAAMEAEGVDGDRAADVVRKVWDKHFQLGAAY